MQDGKQGWRGPRGPQSGPASEGEEMQKPEKLATRKREGVSDNAAQCNDTTKQITRGNLSSTSPHSLPYNTGAQLHSTRPCHRPIRVVRSSARHALQQCPDPAIPARPPPQTPQAAPTMLAPTRRPPHTHTPAGGEAPAGRVQVTPTRCPSHGRHKRVHSCMSL